MKKPAQLFDIKWGLEKRSAVKVFAEFLGTGFLLCVGCMANVGSLGLYPPPSNQTPFNFGLIVNGIIMMLGNISGAYINPAMTLGAVLSGYRSVTTGMMMIVAQVAGAILGFGTLKGITPSHLMNTGYENSPNVCMTLVHSELSSLQGLAVEIICTIVLMMVNCAAWDPKNQHNSDSTPLRIGLVVSGLSIAAAPFTGCSMNPARSLAPALWNNDWTRHWIYWIGPFVGAIVGTFVYKFVFIERTPEPEDPTRVVLPPRVTNAFRDAPNVTDSRQPPAARQPNKRQREPVPFGQAYPTTSFYL